MKKVSLVFPDREGLSSFLSQSHGVHLSIHHRLHCLTADFSEVEIEMAQEKFHAQVFESRLASPPSDTERGSRPFGFPKSFLML
jgi:hypothetical protein